MSQLSFASLTPKKKSPLRSEVFLEQMDAAIPWSKLIALIEPYYFQNSVGRPAYPLEIMLRIYCLQQWYNLGDLSMEEAIYDRRSFQKFLNIDLMNRKIPDETTILNFRHLLEAHALGVQIFALVSKFLRDKGLMMQEGTIVDATLVKSPSSTKNQEKKRDPEMSSTKKNGSWHFGMKNHIGVDSKSGLVHSLETTTAKVADRDKFDMLLHGKETAVYGDKGYMSKTDKYYAKDAGVYWGVMDRGTSVKKLTLWQKKRNHLLAKIRAKVEHPFLVVKHLWGHSKTRYRGLAKNHNQFCMLFALCNLYMVRNRIIQET